MVVNFIETVGSSVSLFITIASFLLTNAFLIKCIPPRRRKTTEAYIFYSLKILQIIAVTTHEFLSILGLYPVLSGFILIVSLSLIPIGIRLKVYKRALVNIFAIISEDFELKIDVTLAEWYHKINTGRSKLKVESSIYWVIYISAVGTAAALLAFFAYQDYKNTRFIEEHQSSINIIKTSYDDVNIDPVKKVDQFSDLSADRNITVDQMDALIEHWCQYKDHSEMIGTGASFIEASKATGYDPIFLMAIAGHESGWGSSKLHTDKNNPYSICMYDYDVYAGLNMGESFGEGIISGAKWIHDNYYIEGQTSLYSMIYGEKCYAQAKDAWINSIVEIMNRSYELLEEGEM